MRMTAREKRIWDVAYGAAFAHHVNTQKVANDLGTSDLVETFLAMARNAAAVADTAVVSARNLHLGHLEEE